MQDSLKKRFVFLISISLMCMVGLVATQVYYERTITGLHEQRALLSDLSEKLLRLRLEQKNFVNQRDTTAIDRVNALVSDLSSSLGRLYPLMRQYELPLSQMQAIQTGFEQYNNELNRIIEISFQIGVDQDSGLRGKFRQAARRLEAEFILLDNEFLQIKLLQMRRNEKDFIERKNPAYVFEQAQWARKIEQSIAQNVALQQQGLMPLLHEYLTEFEQLVQLYEQLGLTSSVGLLQQFQNRSTEINVRITEVSLQLEARVNQAANFLKGLGLFLVMATTGLLFVIVLNSFITLRRGLSGFLNFFEASKTSQAPVIFKDLKFAEFHQVAQMAHQMVQAREQVEEHLRETSEALERANEELTKMATQDALTGIANRRTLDEALSREWHRCQREQKPLGVILIDIDHFKLYNDSYGHQFGDETLVKVAQRLDSLTERATDVTARYGGEEFAVVLSNTSADGAKLMAQRMVDAVQAMAIPHKSSLTSDVVTISAGVFVMVPNGEIPAEKWFTYADQALYDVKRAGRGQVCIKRESEI